LFNRFALYHGLRAKLEAAAWIRPKPKRKETALSPASTGKTVKKVQPALPAVDEAQIDFESIELLFFAYRDFVSDPDAMLATIGMGRAHHRVVYFVCRQPGMMVTDLLDTLQITKQSLARVLKQLIDMGYIRQMAGAKDRRQRRLYPTLAGRELALALSEPQSRRIGRAMEDFTPDMRQAVKHFLLRMRGRDPSIAIAGHELDESQDL
jgi:DNA-binding MarR family transcriptional regulator